MTTETTQPRVIPTQVRSIMERSFIDYAMSVITDRALPDVRDGFKPVHRRILFAMHEAGNEWNKPYKKSARMVGDVIGKYHPHGDQSVYGAGVRMAQPFSMAHLLIDGQGNFGSIDGDNPAAMRYTEMRLTRLAGAMFDDLHSETIAFIPNYDGTESEPSVITTHFPNLLVNGGTGIAVGMASNIPPHNLRAVIDGTKFLMSEDAAAEGSSRALMNILGAPDFPTGGIVYGLDGFAEAMDTGRGRVKLRSRWHEETRGRGGASMLVIDEIPYQVNKADLVRDIADAVKGKKVEDIVNLRDASNKDGVRIEIDIKAGGSAEVVFAKLCKATDLEISFSYNCVVLDNGRPVQLGLRELLERWIAFRRDVVLKRFIFNRKQALAKLHILDAYIAAMGRMDETIAIIRGAQSPDDARTGLMELLGIDAKQAQAILDLRLQKLTGMELDGLRNDHAEVTALVASLTQTIDSPAKIDAVIIDELDAVRDRYGIDRRTEVRNDLEGMDSEDFIKREPVLIAMTRGGYIKRLPTSALAAQNRGTRGKRLMDVGDDDEVNALYHCESHDILMVFTESGKAHAIKAYRVPEAALGTKGRHIRNVIEGLEEKISTVLAIPETDPALSLVTISKLGQVKRTGLDDYRNASRKGGIQAVGLDDGDSLLSAFACRPHDHIMLVSSEGKAIRFDIEDVRVMGRTAGGVRGMRLDDDDVLVGAYVINGNGTAPPVRMRQVQDDDGSTRTVEAPDTSAMDEGRFLICIGERGVGKRTAVREFTVQSRAGKGVTAFKTTRKTGNLVAALGSTIERDLVMFSSNGVSNRITVESVREAGRATSGVILMNLDEGQSVISVTTAMREPDDAGGDDAATQQNNGHNTTEGQA